MLGQYKSNGGSHGAQEAFVRPEYVANSFVPLLLPPVTFAMIISCYLHSCFAAGTGLHPSVIRRVPSTSPFSAPSDRNVADFFVPQTVSHQP